MRRNAHILNRVWGEMSFLKHRWGQVSLFMVTAAAVLAFALIVFRAMSARVTNAGQNISDQCSPHPCLDLEGYTMWVSNVKQSQGVVEIRVEFKNASVSTHADPADLTLLGKNQQAISAIQDAPGCTHWSRTEFGDGERFGPITVCFPASSAVIPYILQWNPDMGLFCCQANLKLTED